MRINKFIALHTSLSRRNADVAVLQKRVTVNGVVTMPGMIINDTDSELLDDVPVRGELPARIIILMNKPVGYVCSRRGQGSKTIYELLPSFYKILKPAGRLDRDSSGLLLLTNDGDLLFELTHPSKQKTKVYSIILSKPLTIADEKNIIKGVELEDGRSALGLKPLDNSRFEWQITMHEGRNRQIRRTFAALDYNIIRLHRTTFGDYSVASIPTGGFMIADESL